MGQRKFRRSPMIKHQICDSADGPVPGYRNHRHSKRMLQRGINGDQRLGASAEKHLTVPLNQVLAMPVMRSEVEVACLHQLIANTTQHLCVIAVAQFGHHDAYGQSTAIAQGTREKTRLIVEFLRGSFNAIASGLGNRTAGNIVEHNRNRGGVQPKILRQFLQADWAIYYRLVLLRPVLTLLQAFFLNVDDMNATNSTQKRPVTIPGLLQNRQRPTNPMPARRGDTLYVARRPDW